jgi:hypothetical protein
MQLECLGTFPGRASNGEVDVASQPLRRRGAPDCGGEGGGHLLAILCDDAHSCWFYLLNCGGSLALHDLGMAPPFNAATPWLEASLVTAKPQVPPRVCAHCHSTRLHPHILSQLCRKRVRRNTCSSSTRVLHYFNCRRTAKNKGLADVYSPRR